MRAFDLKAHRRRLAGMPSYKIPLIARIFCWLFAK
jgi:hypothetical protein